MPPEAPTAFFSYSREDSDFTLRLARDLKAVGARVWIDQLDLEPGREWDNAIEAAVTQSPRMLLILSPASVKSRNVRNEISFALDENKTIIPVLYQDCTVPLQLHRVQYIDFRTDYSHGLTVLLKTLGVEQHVAPEVKAVITEPRADKPGLGKERTQPEPRRRAPEKKPVAQQRRVATENTTQAPSVVRREVMAPAEPEEGAGTAQERSALFYVLVTIGVVGILASLWSLGGLAGLVSPPSFGTGSGDMAESLWPFYFVLAAICLWKAFALKSTRTGFKAPAFLDRHHDLYCEGQSLCSGTRIRRGTDSLEPDFTFP